MESFLHWIFTHIWVFYPHEGQDAREAEMNESKGLWQTATLEEYAEVIRQAYHHKSACLELLAQRIECTKADLVFLEAVREMIKAAD